MPQNNNEEIEVCAIVLPYFLEQIINKQISSELVCPFCGSKESIIILREAHCNNCLTKMERRFYNEK